ncbi:MAG: class I SAM-dependent methyltransferase [Rhodospirillales bacterium]|nr:class I SAM-dependent methyltransferase [Rhodospirillales bacterium]
MHERHPLSKYRQRIYGDYVRAATTPIAPPTRAGLEPRRHHLRKLIADYFPSDRKAAIVDLGCGHGALLHFAAAAGYVNVTGVDASPAQVAAAETLGIKGVQQGDLFAALRAMADASHDAVIAFDVIEHLTKDELIDLTDEVLRVLKPGGRWIVHVPNALSPFGGAIRYGDLTHELAFTPESLSQLFLSSGFASAIFHEDQPVAHGLKSLVRLALWKAIRQLLRFYLTVETGSAQTAVFTQNLFAVAIK